MEYNFYFKQIIFSKFHLSFFSPIHWIKFRNFSSQKFNLFFSTREEEEEEEEEGYSPMTNWRSKNNCIRREA